MDVRRQKRKTGRVAERGNRGKERRHSEASKEWRGVGGGQKRIQENEGREDKERRWRQRRESGERKKLGEVSRRGEERTLEEETAHT